MTARVMCGTPCLAVSPKKAPRARGEGDAHQMVLARNGVAEGVDAARGVWGEAL
jgi:hypothetical protein